MRQKNTFSIFNRSQAHARLYFQELRGDNFSLSSGRHAGERSFFGKLFDYKFFLCNFVPHFGVVYSRNCKAEP